MYYYLIKLDNISMYCYNCSCILCVKILRLISIKILKGEIFLMNNVFEKYINQINDYSCNSFKPFLDIGSESIIINEKYREDILNSAHNLLNKEYEVLPVSVYMQFRRNGNRSNYENIYFNRRRLVFLFLIAEYIEQKGRFTDKLLDGLQLILEETTWVIPAHNKSRKGIVDPISYCYKDDVDNIDLFSAETGALLAWIYYLGNSILDAQTKIFCERILYELNKKIIEPFLKYDDMWWMGTKGQVLNNWTPWIISNILTTAMLCVKDDKKRSDIINYSMVILDRFIVNYHEDGGCDEGPSYWGVAGGSYFDCCEILYDLSGGAINVFDNKNVCKIGEYIALVNVCDKYYLNFADCPASFNPDFYMINRFGRRCCSDIMYDFTSYNIYNKNIKPHFMTNGQYYRVIKNLCDIDIIKKDYNPPEKIWFDGLCIAAKRTSDLYLAAKGGHNAESHNHNDVGSFVVYAGGEPLFIDAGVGTYTADTFNANRWKIWLMRSEYHNLPTINGKVQEPGGKFKAKNILYNPDCNNLKMELTEAYPEEADIKFYIREFTFNEFIVIEDKIAFRENGSIEFNLLTKYKPEFKKAGFIDFDFKNVINNEYLIEYDKSLIPDYDEIEITDPKIISGWGQDVLYRIRLKSKEDITESNYKLTIKKV